MSTTSENAARACPQCEGAGQEEIGAIPIVCRKCGGSGSTSAMRRVAAVMCGGEALEKTAQGNLDDDLADELAGGQDEDPDAPDGEFQGTGFDQLAVVSKDTTDDQLRMEIATPIDSLFADGKKKLFERVLVILGSNAEEVGRTVAGRDGQPSEAKIEEFLYSAIGRMNRQQLCSTYCELRRLL